ncbi:MAG: glycosyltransferase family 9 protein [Ignavibacteriaceae bacterium]|nr:glycosyltransferase family 9 protein [Ignavibacteriaceae bacterium]
MRKILVTILRLFFGKLKICDRTDVKPNNVLIVLTHFSPTELIATTPLINAIKINFPVSRITVVFDRSNSGILSKNSNIDRTIVFDKKKLFKYKYISNFWRYLREEYDLALVPVYSKFSLRSDLIARISGARIKAGVSSINKRKNPSAFCFNIKAELIWLSTHDNHISEKIASIADFVNISVTKLESTLETDYRDEFETERFLKRFESYKERIIIGINASADRLGDRWYYPNFVLLIKRLKQKYDACIYLTGFEADRETVNSIVDSLPFTVLVFTEKTTHEFSALISKSDLYVTSNSLLMHIAGCTDTPQISLFGTTDPLEFAPLGKNKYFMKKSDIVDEIPVEEVFDLSEQLIKISPRVRRGV